MLVSCFLLGNGPGRERVVDFQWARASPVVSPAARWRCGGICSILPEQDCALVCFSFQSTLFLGSSVAVEENKRQAQVNMIKLHNTVPCFRASQLLSDFEIKIRFGLWKEIRGNTPQWKAKRINKKPWYVSTLRIQLRPCVVALFWNVSNFPDLLINFIRLRRLSLWQWTSRRIF